MKYGITERLDPAIADRLQRLHTALLLRAYARQVGTPAVDALDLLLSLAEEWDSAPSTPSPQAVP